jgi:hypothetical protein
MIETELRTFLIPSSSAIPAIGTRLYIGNLPDSVTYPCVSMFPISQVEIPEAEQWTDRIQFSCFAENLSSATDIALAIKTKMKKFYGKTSSTSTYTILDSYPENLTYRYEPTILKHIKDLDMSITYRR